MAEQLITNCIFNMHANDVHINISFEQKKKKTKTPFAHMLSYERPYFVPTNKFIFENVFIFLLFPFSYEICFTYAKIHMKMYTLGEK